MSGISAELLQLARDFATWDFGLHIYLHLQRYYTVLKYFYLLVFLLPFLSLSSFHAGFSEWFKN